MNKVANLKLDLVRNLLLALVLSTFLWVYQGVGFIAHVEQFSIDWLSRFQQLYVDKESDVSFTVIEIDDKTWDKWGQPLFVPRDKLKSLLGYASNSSATAIVVDIDLSLPGESVTAQKLLEFVQSYNEVPILIFVKRLSEDKAGAVQAAQSFLDSAVTSNDKVFWASAYFNVNESLEVRSTNLWNDLDDGRVVPSIQYLLAKYLHVQPFAQGVEQRIIFRIPWQLPQGTTMPNVNVNGVERPILLKRSALPLVDNEYMASSAWLDDTVVLIGSSVADNKDRYITALGPMPGFFIIINAINSYFELGQVTKPPFWLTILIELVMIALMSYAFARFNSMIGLLLSSLFFVLAVVPICILLLERGMWFNLVIPLLTVQFMHFISNFDERFTWHK